MSIQYLTAYLNNEFSNFNSKFDFNFNPYRMQPQPKPLVSKFIDCFDLVGEISAGKSRGLGGLVRVFVWNKFFFR